MKAQLIKDLKALKEATTHCSTLVHQCIKTSSKNFKLQDSFITADGKAVLTYTCDIDNKKYTVMINPEN